jgi:diaminohydroxyphosphoribosylaminopyrimidine deaminase/5-amino-6-(5-phosphoribosylamino)uracil reductase
MKNNSRHRFAVVQFMRLALRLARRGYGTTSPNPTVGAVLVKGGKIIGRGRTAPVGGPHAEIEALRDAQKRSHNPQGATLYVTLEPCCSHGRTTPCTDAIIAAGIKRVIVGAIDPNPKHAGRGFKILRRAGIAVTHPGAAPFGVPRLRGPDRLKAELQTKLADECARLNESFNYWIVHRTPFVTVKAAMTLDGKIATASGESKWITGEKARACGMQLRQGNDAILVGINTILADDPSLTARANTHPGNIQHSTFNIQHPILRRVVLDSMARTPLKAKVVSDEFAALTTIVVTKQAPKNRLDALGKSVNVLVAPTVRNPPLVTRHPPLIDLDWLLKKLGAENVTSLLVEGGGEVNASFLLGGFAHRVAFFYASKILGGRDSRKGVAGDGVKSLSEVIQLREVEWRKLGADLLLTARVAA